MNDKRDATEAEQWLDNFNLYIDGGVHGYYPACNDHTVPGELAKLLATVRAEARRQALLDAVDLLRSVAEEHDRVDAFIGAAMARLDIERIRSLTEPKEKP